MEIIKIIWIIHFIIVSTISIPRRLNLVSLFFVDRHVLVGQKNKMYARPAN